MTADTTPEAAPQLTLTDSQAQNVALLAQFSLAGDGNSDEFATIGARLVVLTPIQLRSSLTDEQAEDVVQLVLAARRDAEARLAWCYSAGPLRRPLSEKAHRARIRTARDMNDAILGIYASLSTQPGFRYALARVADKRDAAAAETTDA